MPDPAVPINMRLDLQNHALVPLLYLRKLIYLEHLYVNGLLVWRGDKPPTDLPPQRQGGLEGAAEDPDEQRLSEAGPVSTIQAGAFMPPSPPLSEQFGSGGGTQE